MRIQWAACILLFKNRRKPDKGKPLERVGRKATGLRLD